MNKTKKIVYVPVALLMLTALISGKVNAALIVSNWNITGNTLTYDIAGTIDAGMNIGPISPNRLFIGVPGDTDWVTSNGVVSSVINHPGATRIVKTPRYLNDVGVFFSDYTWLDTNDFDPYVVGDVINASVTAVGGTLVGENIVKEHIVVAAGRATATGALAVVPQAAYQVGAYATEAVPEPSTLLLLGIGSLVLTTRKSAGRVKTPRITNLCS